MNYLAFSFILVFISSFSMGIVALVKGNRNKVIIGFSMFVFAVAFWALSGYGFSTASSKENAIFWWQMAYISVILSPVLYYNFVYYLLNLSRTKLYKIILISAYFFAILFLCLNFFARDSFLGNLKFLFNKYYFLDWPNKKSLSFLFFFTLFYVYLLPYSLILLVREHHKTKGIIKNQLRYIIVASVVGWMGSTPFFLIIFNLSNFYPFSNFFTFFYPFIITYAILKYRLMDIRVAITRASAFVVVYTLVLGIPFAVAFWSKSLLVDLFGSSWWIVPFVLLAVLATSGPFIYIYIERKAENALLHEQKRYQNTLKQASIGMTRIRSLHKLLDLITHIVTRTVRIAYASVYLYDSQSNEYVLQVSRDKGRTPIPKIAANNPLVLWVMLKREPLVYEEIKHMMEDTGGATYKHLEENMRMLTAAVVIPSFLEDKIMGLIILGEKISGHIYTPDDLNVFQVLASQAALAIENAQFYEEAKEMQDQISQAEKMATIGTMADGLSHQINNRFYALSLIAGDTIDTIKLTDTSNCSPEVKEMITSVTKALDRIQANVMQGGEVVKGILKYTRKGDEKFEPVTVDQVIDGTLEMVQFKVKLSEIDIVRNYEKTCPKIKGNLTQLEEVFFNFIDNAYDAIVERKNALQEVGYRGKITFSAKPKGDNLEIVVEDNGMGVKDENLKKVFTPFFTTKISARKGTGLGLYVIHRIISDIHKGTINFESKHKVGTRFVVCLPLAK